jgi:polar amino acid transport system substrate-binding protein
MKRIALFLIVSILSFSGHEIMAGCDSRNLHFHERIPYVHEIENGVEGFTATPATAAFQKADIPFQWKKTPSKRQMLIIKNNKGCDCAVGWFKNPEREKFAKYTLPIYQDRPQIALTRADNEKLRSGMTVDSLFSDPNLILGVKNGYSYGIYLDMKIVQHKPAVEKTTCENINMLKLIHVRRWDYFFIAPEEADWLIESSGLSKKDFKYIEFKDIPEGEKRYIMCSQKVGDEIIERLNKAITEEDFLKSKK